jgi:hypothetical protein
MSTRHCRNAASVPHSQPGEGVRRNPGDRQADIHLVRLAAPINLQHYFRKKRLQTAVQTYTGVKTDKS